MIHSCCRHRGARGHLAVISPPRGACKPSFPTRSLARSPQTRDQTEGISGFPTRQICLGSRMSGLTNIPPWSEPVYCTWESSSSWPINRSANAPADNGRHRCRGLLEALPAASRDVQHLFPYQPAEPCACSRTVGQAGAAGSGERAPGSPQYLRLPAPRPSSVCWPPALSGWQWPSSSAAFPRGTWCWPCWVGGK